MLAEKDSYIHHAYQQLQIISQNKEKRLEYETREKALRDHNQLMFEAKQSGLEEGIGIGKEKEAIRIAKDLLLLNVPDEIIIKSTKLTIEQLQSLKNS